MENVTSIKVEQDGYGFNDISTIKEEIEDSLIEVKKEHDVELKEENLINPLVNTMLIKYEQEASYIEIELDRNACDPLATSPNVKSELVENLPAIKVDEQTSFPDRKVNIDKLKKDVVNPLVVTMLIKYEEDVPNITDDDETNVCDSLATSDSGSIDAVLEEGFPTSTVAQDSQYNLCRPTSSSDVYKQATSANTGYKSLHQTRKHIDETAAKTTLNKCTQCEYSTSNKIYFKKHTRLHTEQKSYNCDHCKYSTNIKSNITRHKRTHTKEKPFKCTYCEYSASQKSHIITHMGRHTNKNPFKCTICEYSSALKSIITIHMRTHTKEKPFKCTYCEHSASQKSHIIRHKKRIYPKDKLSKSTI